MAWRQPRPVPEQRDAARLGRLLYVVSGLVVLATEWLLPSSSDRLVLGAFAVAAIGIGCAVPLLPWDRWPDRALLAMPALGQTMIGFAGVAVEGSTQRYVMLYAVTYLFVGLTQPPGTAFCVIPLTILTYAIGAPLDSPSAWFDFVLVITIAVLIAETLARTIARRDRAESTVRRLLDASQALARSATVAEATTLIADAVTETLHTDLVAVNLQDPERSGRYVETSHHRTLDVVGEDLDVDTSVEQTGVAVTVARREVLFISDARTSPIPSRRLVESSGVESLLYIPLLGRDRCLGVVITGWKRPVRTLGEVDRQVVETLSTEAGLVIERLEAQAELAREAESEPLTGLANRRTFTRALETARPSDAIVMIDLDGFKAVNDRYGHGIGDDVLLAMADCLRRSCRDDDCVSRFGGDEFAVVLRGGGRTAARALLDRLAEAWRETDPLVGYSAGVALCREGEDTASALERADRALYQSKRLSRDAPQPVLVID